MDFFTESEAGTPGASYADRAPGAIEDGADWVEIDVQETLDGEVVVIHDSDFMKLAGGDRRCAARSRLRPHASLGFAHVYRG